MKSKSDLLYNAVNHYVQDVNLVNMVAKSNEMKEKLAEMQGIINDRMKNIYEQIDVSQAFKNMNIS